MPSSQSSSRCCVGKSRCAISEDSDLFAKSASSSSLLLQSDSDLSSFKGAAGVSASSGSSSPGDTGASPTVLRTTFGESVTSGASPRVFLTTPVSSSLFSPPRRLRCVTFSNVVLPAAARSCAPPTTSAACAALPPTCLVDFPFLHPSCNTRSMAFARSSSLYIRVRFFGCPATL